MGKLTGIAVKVGGWIVILSVTLGIGGAVALMVAPKVLGWNAVIVLTGSMEPALKVGGLAFVEPTTDASSVEVGDVITFKALRNPNKSISHRVIGIIDEDRGLFFETKGDNSPLPDQQPIPAANLVGKVRFHVPYLGHVADKLRHRENFYVLLGIPAGLLIAGEVMNIARELKKMRAAKEASA